MSEDRIDLVLSDWSEARPDLSTEALGIVLRIQYLARNLAEKLTESLGKLGLEWWAYDVLSVLRRQGDPFQMTASDLAEAAMLSTGAMTNRIDGLVDRGWVVRVLDPNDRRKVIVGLTEAGRCLVDRATGTRFDCAKASVGHLSPRQQSQFNDQLRQMVFQNDGKSLTNA